MSQAFIGLNVPAGPKEQHLNFLISLPRCGTEEEGVTSETSNVPADKRQKWNQTISIS